MTESQAITAGRTLGRYQLLASIARGGMGQVWLGRLKGARGFHKLVAVKTLLAPQDEAEGMMLEEARIASLIHHANVVQTIELGEDAGTLYLVMEWVDGEPLSQVLVKAQDKGGLPLGVATNLIAQMLRGLHAAHELCDESGSSLGVVHRDVSPHNVLVTYNGTAKLLDFGIAKATKRTSSSGRTSTGQVKGKFAYMAPEQILGTTIDRRTDLFAAGIMLYTLTVGRHPFKHHNDAGVLHAITGESPAPAPSKFKPDYPKALEAVVMKAIEKDVSRRFASAEEMRLALEQAVAAALPTGDALTGRFISELLAENAVARREAVRRTLVRADSMTPNGGTPAIVQNGQSVGSLGAVAVDRPGTGSGAARAATGAHTVQRLDSKLPLARSRKRYQTALFAAMAVAGVAVWVATKSLTSHATFTGSRPPAAARPVVEAPQPVSPAPSPALNPIPDAGSDPAREIAPEAPAESTAVEPARPASAAPKAAAKREKKSSAPAEDLIAPY